MNENLFDDNQRGFYEPLAARMRPRNLAEYIGQEQLLGDHKPLRMAIESGQLHSMILWGPPGTGKTSLAKLLASHIKGHFQSLSAVLSGVKDIRDAVQLAEHRRIQSGQQTVLFVDEVHRFNKAQQDAFLPYVESGVIIFVGATTENPSFEVNNALLSRCRVYVLESIAIASLKKLVCLALEDPDRGLGQRHFILNDEALGLLVAVADGDARRALTLLELASDLADEGGQISKDHIERIAVGDARRFDKGGDLFYEQISALHKSVRGSSPDAALYWFARMIDGGCDPIYIARRVVRMASEDIGNADPRALEISMSAWQVQERLGSPEGQLALAQAITYLAAAPKSNAVYNAYKSVMGDVKKMPSYAVPMHLRNAPTTLMKDLEFGRAYRYAHDEPEAFAAGENYFPDEVEPRHYYQPVERGLEIKIAEKLRKLNTLNKRAKADD